VQRAFGPPSWTPVLHPGDPYVVLLPLQPSRQGLSASASRPATTSSSFMSCPSAHAAANAASPSASRAHVTVRSYSSWIAMDGLTWVKEVHQGPVIHRYSSRIAAGGMALRSG